MPLLKRLAMQLKTNKDSFRGLNRRKLFYFICDLEAVSNACLASTISVVMLSRIAAAGRVSGALVECMRRVITVAVAIRRPGARSAVRIAATRAVVVSVITSTFRKVLAMRSVAVRACGSEPALAGSCRSPLFGGVEDLGACVHVALDVVAGGHQ